MENINKASTSLENHPSTLATVAELQKANDQFKLEAQASKTAIKSLIGNLEKAKGDKEAEIFRLKSYHKTEIQGVRGSLLKAEQALKGYYIR